MCALYMVYYYRAENRKRDTMVAAREGDIAEGGEEHARHDLRMSFRYVL